MKIRSRATIVIHRAQCVKASHLVTNATSEIAAITRSMSADQKEIDEIRAETRSYLDKTQAILDSF